MTDSSRYGFKNIDQFIGKSTSSGKFKNLNAVTKNLDKVAKSKREQRLKQLGNVKDTRESLFGESRNPFFK